jgi:hypothetical protein
MSSRPDRGKRQKRGCHRDGPFCIPHTNKKPLFASGRPNPLFLIQIKAGFSRLEWPRAILDTPLTDPLFTKIEKSDRL